MTASTKDLIERIRGEQALQQAEYGRGLHVLDEAADALDRLTQPVGEQQLVDDINLLESLFKGYPPSIATNEGSKTVSYLRVAFARLTAERDSALSEVSRLTTELMETKADLAATKGERNAFQDQCVRRKREMDELRAQEPVAELDIWDSFSELPSGTKLFAHPVPAAQAVPVEFLLDGARFKLSFQPIRCDECGAEHDKVAVEPLGMYANELDGKWVALVPAENDRHLKMAAAPKPPAVPNDDALLFAAEAKRSGQ